MIIAELSITPLGEGTNVSGYVKAALKALERSGLKMRIGAMSTALEAPDLETLFRAVVEAEEAVIGRGAERVVMDLKIDDRRDREASIESKIGAVR